MWNLHSKIALKQVLRVWIRDMVFFLATNQRPGMVTTKSDPEYRIKIPHHNLRTQLQYLWLKYSNSLTWDPDSVPF
jgi:hypothetical protein